jgi:hypothetical protein
MIGHRPRETLAEENGELSLGHTPDFPLYPTEVGTPAQHRIFDRSTLEAPPRL